MQSHSHVNEQSNILDKLNLIVQALEEALKMFIKLTEKFEHFLAVIGALSMKVKTASGAFDEEPECAAPNVVKDGIESPTVGGLHEIAGLRGIKNLLHTLVILPRTQPQLFENRSKTNCILLYGPPGTGKTRLANALAAESGATFHSMSAGNFMSPNVGETERNLRQIFQYLRANDRFAILFIDEIDGIGRRRTTGEHDYSRRIKTELMAQMTTVDRCPNVLIIAATNCPWDLDPAILRRFNKQIYVPLPNSEERLELFQLLTRNTEIIQTPQQLQELIQLCDGFSGSDISTLVHAALEIPLTELQLTTLWSKTVDGFYEPFKGFREAETNAHEFDTNVEDVCVNQLRSLPAFSVRARPVSVADFIDAAEQVHKTVTYEELAKYEAFKQPK
ncbi:hypothetical protein HUJ04_004379 [Dendroctonus ponderosae]|uniref:AAA+ ATPase domain-containing protein n=1 Tax=Dendroctonus ponderosae TaxID=77166 RepID=A0AAR5PB85_DENPD|nr:hypothetical protein HUJ04_004379 [Dendroctonus ponderosae]